MIHDDIIEFINNPLSYDQKLVFIINTKGEIIPLSASSELYSKEPKTIKVEGMERFSKEVYDICQHFKYTHSFDGPVTCHAFIAQEDSPSFPMHTDPDDVIIFCVDGKKTLDINGQSITLNPQESVFIPADTPHRATNEFASVMLSIGLEKFLIDKAKNYELDAISKNDGNV